MVKRRVIRGAALIMAILLCTFVLMSCTQKETTQQTGQTQPTQAEKDKTWETKTDTLRVATVSVGSQLPANEAFTKATGVKLEWVEMGQDDLHTKMATAFAAGNMDYDLIWSYAANTAEWASVGYLEDITDKIDKAIMGDLNPGSFDATVYKGRFYGLPRFTSVNILWYNKAIFREANLDPESPPKTWEEFVDAAKKTTYDSDGDGKIDKYGVVFSFGTPYGATIQWELLLYLNGGKMFDENDNVTFNDEKGVAALKMLRELFDLGVVEPSSLSNPGGWDQSQVFIQGNTAMSICWSNTYKFANDPKTSNIVGELGWATIPQLNGRMAAVSGSEGYVITKASKYKATALDYLEFIAKEEGQLLVSKASMFPPVRLSMYESDAVYDYMPAIGAFKEQAKGYSNRFAAPYGLEVTDALMAEVVNCLKGNIEPQDALNNAAAKAKEIVKDFK